MKWLAQHLPEEAGMWLADGEDTFFALWQPDRSGDAKGVILILHAEGEHPAWPQTTKPLHDTLPDYGWATLAISLPPTSKIQIPKRAFPVKTTVKTETSESQPPATPDNTSQEATTKRSSPTAELSLSVEPETTTNQRLESTLKFLHDHGQFNIVMMGSGIGAIRAYQFMNAITPQISDEELKKPLEKPIRAMIIYNARNKLPTKSKHYQEWFIDPEIPIMDIFTTNDRRNIKDARKRQILAKQKNAIAYHRVKLAEMSHEKFWGENRLSRRIRSFLDANAQGVEIDNAKIKNND
ncbi:hypothetical protein AB835_12490 [Candidatus Endobugula sertula]|uniref:DUF3530 domain-containing protein n=1 Tax=Candidatus Endobugula sertula TaxID=62101 RepID=A0A1D2QME2_9GAMM|nr:hypothetical protein AB835_12490 [Candidatus Endobugula sertula]